MLTHYVWEDPDNATKYYDNGEYYTKEPELGVWTGKGAATMRLAGDVVPAHFSALCRNRHPFTGQKVKPKDPPRRRKQEDSPMNRIGYDFTFSLPKSASILCLVMGDKRILDVLDEAVLKTLEVMEKTMAVRVRMNGQMHDRETGNMVAAFFRHYLTRPQDGWADPHAHKHAMIFNMTHDIDGKWRAGQFGRMLDMADMFEEVFDGHVARGIGALGYEVEWRGKKMEIKTVPESIVRKFSRRSQQIEDLAKELKIRDPKLKGKLSVWSRDGKDKGIVGDKLQDKWRSELTDEEFHILQEAIATAQKGPVVPNPQCARNLIDSAIRHLFERASVLPEYMLLLAALKSGQGTVGLADLKKALDASDMIREEVEGETWLTTPTVLREEHENITFVKEGRGTFDPIDLVPEKTDQEILSDEQWQAVRHVLTSSDQVTAIAGAPGTGKTTLMKAAITRMEAAGLRVFTCAPSADASRGVLREEGFGDADTLYKLLHDPKLQNDLTGQVVWVDEAGLIGSAQMHHLFDLAAKKDFRIVLSGDTGQHSPVPRGDALRLLETHAGLKPARVRTIRRQKSEEYRVAVNKISSGDVANGFRDLDKSGFIEEIPTPDRNEALVKAYLAAIESEQSCLVVSPTHEEGDIVTDRIRNQLRKTDQLGKKVITVCRLKNRNYSEEKRALPLNYSVGMIVQFNDPVPGGKFLRGNRVTVTSVSSKGVEVMQHGKKTSLPLDRADKFTVYDERELELSPGDFIRITRNGYAKERNRLSNGARYQVHEFTKEGDIILTNGMVLPPDFGHLSHGYCLTSMASQGKTVDHVIIAQSAKSLGASANREQFNVSVSRGKENVTIFTDNKAKLLKAVSKTSARKSAHDLISPNRRKILLGQSNRHRLNQRIDALKQFSQVSSPEPQPSTLEIEI